jgi:hypothetical protein
LRFLSPRGVPSAARPESPFTGGPTSTPPKLLSILDYTELVFLFLPYGALGSFFAVLLYAPLLGSISSVSGEPEKVIRIGYQKSGVFLLLRNEGALERKFAPLGYAIEWREFSYGSPILEALNAGSIDI